LGGRPPDDERHALEAAPVPPLDFLRAPRSVCRAYSECTLLLCSRTPTGVIILRGLERGAAGGPRSRVALGRCRRPRSSGTPSSPTAVSRRDRSARFRGATTESRYDIREFWWNPGAGSRNCALAGEQKNAGRPSHNRLAWLECASIAPRHKRMTSKLSLGSQNSHNGCAVSSRWCIARVGATFPRISP